MTNHKRIKPITQYILLICVGLACNAMAADGSDVMEHAAAVRAKLDAPLLFTKRVNYNHTHIYDTYYTYRPGGGIYVIENPAAEPSQQKIRPVIDPTTPETLGGCSSVSRVNRAAGRIEDRLRREPPAVRAFTRSGSTVGGCGA